MAIDQSADPGQDLYHGRQVKPPPDHALKDVDSTFSDLVIGYMARVFGNKFHTLPPATVEKFVLGAWQMGGAARAAFDNYMGGDTGTVTTLAQVGQQIIDTLSNPDLSDNPELVDAWRALKVEQSIPLGGKEKATELALDQKVIAPFANYGVSGNDYGQSVDPNSASGAYGPIHFGIDYGTPEGTAIFTPFGGTLHIQTGIPSYGNLVYVTMPDGSQIRFGHVAGAVDGLVDGMVVQPGDQIAISGANVGDSQGAVTLVEWKDPQGNLVNPHKFLDPIWTGTTYKALRDLGLGTGAIGAGIDKTDAAYRKYGITDRTLATVYAPASGLWKKYFGKEPTTHELQGLVAGGKDPTQMEDYIRKMNSHLPGMNIGQYTDFRGLTDSASTKYLGHGSTDGVVKDLWTAQTTSAAGVDAWYQEHAPNQISEVEKK